jgi:hypothetical protein
MARTGRTSIMTTTIATTLGLLSYFRGEDVWVKPEDAKAAFDAAGIPQEIPDVTKPGYISGRISYAARNFRASTGIIRVDATATRTTGTAEYGLLRKVDVSDHEVRWDQFDSVTWTEAAGFSTPASPEAAEFIAYAHKVIGHLNYYWFRTATFQHLHRLGVFAFAGGGLVYVHTDLKPGFEKLQRVINSFPGARLHAIALDASDASTVDAVGAAAQEHALGQVEDVVARLAAWREKASGRKSTIEALLTELTDVRGRALALSEALKYSTGEIEAAIGAAEIELRATLDAVVSAPKPEKAAKPAAGPSAEEIAAAAELARLKEERDAMAAELAALRASVPAAPEARIEPEPEEGIPGADTLAELSESELRKLCHQAGIKGYARQSAATMISRLTEKREQLATA